MTPKLMSPAEPNRFSMRWSLPATTHRVGDSATTLAPHSTTCGPSSKPQEKMLALGIGFSSTRNPGKRTIPRTTVPPWLRWQWVQLPESYASSPEIQNNLQLLRGYLNRRSAAQSTINRVFLLWASSKLPGLLWLPRSNKRSSKEILGTQRADGGWRPASIAWKWSGWIPKKLVNMWIREDGTPMDGKSDGVATGLITLALQEAGVSRDNVQLKRGISWLANNQNPSDGSWPASSVNKRRHVSSDTGRFMSDAATAFGGAFIDRESASY